MISEDAERLAAVALMRGAIAVSKRKARPDLVERFTEVAPETGNAPWARAMRVFRQAYMLHHDLNDDDVQIATDTALDIVEDGSPHRLIAADLIRGLLVRLDYFLSRGDDIDGTTEQDDA